MQVLFSHVFIRPGRSTRLHVYASHVYSKKPPSPTGLERGLDVIKKYNTHHI